MCWDNENVMKTPWKQINFFMVNEYFHIQRLFMTHENFEPIKNPWNCTPWKSLGFFHGLLKTHECYFFLPIKFHGFFTSFFMDFYVMWVISRAMNMEIFTGFSCLFKYFFMAKTPWKSPWKIPWKTFEYVMNLPWIKQRDFHGFWVCSDLDQWFIVLFSIPPVSSRFAVDVAQCFRKSLTVYLIHNWQSRWPFRK